MLPMLPRVGARIRWTEDQVTRTGRIVLMHLAGGRRLELLRARPDGTATVVEVRTRFEVLDPDPLG